MLQWALVSWGMCMLCMEYVAYNFVRSIVSVVFAVVVNRWFVVVSLFFVRESLFVSVIRWPRKGIVCNKFVGVVSRNVNSLCIKL